MRRLRVFNLSTLDGYIAGPRGDISWHQVDPEFQAFAEKNSNAGATLLFGRVTYELMASYWPSPEALRTDPVVARGMNSAPKVVYSRTLDRADWANTRLVKKGLLEDVRRMKRGKGKGLTILGSGTIVAQLADAGLIDEYQILLNPVALGSGRSMFEGLKKRLDLRLKDVRRFKNGSVLLLYVQ